MAAGVFCLSPGCLTLLKMVYCYFRYTKFNLKLREVLPMKLMVIDGNSIVNRAFYGVSQNLSTRCLLYTSQHHLMFKL